MGFLCQLLKQLNFSLPNKYYLFDFRETRKLDCSEVWFNIQLMNSNTLFKCTTFKTINLKSTNIYTKGNTEE